MIKHTLLNAPLQHTIATMGHTDCLTVCDAGLPIPNDANRIDLALSAGIPDFMQTVNVIGTSLFVERVVLAEEIKTHNPTLHQEIITWLELLGVQQGNTIVLDYCTHEVFKAQSHQSKAFVRTGECRPYANILLFSGVVF